jgi:hypothetical protein
VDQAQSATSRKATRSGGGTATAQQLGVITGVALVIVIVTGAIARTRSVLIDEMCSTCGSEGLRRL